MSKSSSKKGNKKKTNPRMLSQKPIPHKRSSTKSREGIKKKAPLGEKRVIKTISSLNLIHFDDKTVKEFSHLLHDAEGNHGVVVPVTYSLQKSSDVSFLSLSIGFTHIDLAADEDPADPDSFATRNGKKYMCINQEDGLKVTTRANGKIGGRWSLNITVGDTALGDNPIEEQTDKHGHLDHDENNN